MNVYRMLWNYGIDAHYDLIQTIDKATDKTINVL